MDDLDIQTAQLIIQLARDDIYQLDDIASSGNNQDVELLSDLEFALAEQEREFMQYWAEYGDTQINQDVGRQAGGSNNTGGGDNVGNSGSAVAGPSHVPDASVPGGAESPTPIDLIDLADDEDDDFYVNPYEPVSAASSSNHGRARSSQPPSRAATPALPIPNIDLHSEPASAASSSDRNHDSNDRFYNPFTSAGDTDGIDASTTNTGATTSFPSASLNDEIPHPSSPTLEQLLSQVFAFNSPESQSASSSVTSNSVHVSSGPQVPRDGSSNSVPLFGSSSNTFGRPQAPRDGPSNSIPSSSNTFGRPQAPRDGPSNSIPLFESIFGREAADTFFGHQVPQAGSSNPVPPFGSSSIAFGRVHASPAPQVPQANAVSAVSTPIRPVSLDDHAVEIIAEYQAARSIEAPKARVVSGPVVDLTSDIDEELSDDEGGSISGESINTPAESDVECHFCKDVYPISTTINMSCNHRLCRGCISRLVGICIKDETTYPPQCCGNKLQTNELRMLDHNLRQQFQDKVREYETPIPVRVYCHRCGGFLDPNSSTISTGSSSSSAMSVHTSRYCDSCFVRTCVSCKQASHPTRECRETLDEKALKDLAKQKGWQTCPRCKAVVELSAGCYHVMCRCSAQFCYVCATRWKECDCPAFDEDRLLAMAA